MNLERACVKTLLAFFLLLTFMILSGCSVEPSSVTDTNTKTTVMQESTTAPASIAEPETEEDMTIKLILKIDGREIAVEWEENESVEVLKQLATKKPIEMALSMYGDFEQVGAIGSNLPRNDVQMTTNAGDIVLYQGNQIVIFYGSNTWSYTKLGSIKNLSQKELTELLGNGDVSITLYNE